jgi:uncharacterized cupredoxin-like copper-binding protein
MRKSVALASLIYARFECFVSNKGDPMKFLQLVMVVLGAGLFISAPAMSAFAGESVVHVSLWDRGPDSMSMLGTGKMQGMGIVGADMSKRMMGIKVDAETVPAGVVTFEVVNSSKDMIHEMVIAPVADPNVPLPYEKTLEKVDEDAAGHLGEVAELEPGHSGALKLTLKLGKYILYCNIPGHYAVGMWVLITVTR